MKQVAKEDMEQLTAFQKAVANMSNDEIGQWLEEILPILSSHNDRVNAFKHTKKSEYHGPSSKELKKGGDVCSRQIRLASIQLQFRLEAEIKAKRNTEVIKALKDICDSRLKLSDEIGGVLTKFNDEKYRRFDRITRFIGLVFGVPAAAAAITDKIYPGNIWAVSSAALTTLIGCGVGVFPDETAAYVQLAGKWTLAKTQTAIRKSHQLERQSTHYVRYKAITTSFALSVSEMSRDIPSTAIRKRTPMQVEQRLAAETTPSRGVYRGFGPSRSVRWLGSAR
jgi:hypothetical protein